VKARRESDVDVVVIGGGVNGTGVARDLAMRGAKVELIEKNDLAFGASGNSSGMIHGGARYLTSHPTVTESSCRDSGFIQDIAPHLLFRIPFLMPILRDGPARNIFLTLVDAFFRAYDDYQPLKRGKPHTRLSPDELTTLEPGLVGDVVGGISFDEWGTDGGRLCTLNALDASQRGAKIRVHVEVIDIVRENDAPGARAIGVRWRDLRSGEIGTTTARVIVNASGAWGPLTGALGGVPVKIRPTKGIHVVYDRRLSNYALATNAVDGRQVFLEPWQNMSVLGTTDDDYYGDLDDVRPTGDEVRYLVQAIAKIFPAIRTARAIGVYTGVRPSLFEWGKVEDKVTREHAIVDHGKKHRGDVPGLYSMIGGKLASYRVFAEEMSDVAARDLGITERCRTHVAKLPGGDAVPDALVVADELDIAPVAARRLVYRHGSRVRAVAERIAKQPDEARVVCICEPVLEAEVRQVLDEEFASTVDDVARRTRLGLGACGGMRCALRCGQIVAQETGISQREGRRQALRFLTRQRTLRAPALGPDQARQEVLAINHLAAQVGEADSVD
jgi:glycerol-3-phosphate dehydrogenase